MHSVVEGGRWQARMVRLGRSLPRQARAQFAPEMVRSEAGHRICPRHRCPTGRGIMGEGGTGRQNGACAPAPRR